MEKQDKIDKEKQRKWKCFCLECRKRRCFMCQEGLCSLHHTDSIDDEPNKDPSKSKEAKKKEMNDVLSDL
jgi:hypothetical protein